MKLVTLWHISKLHILKPLNWIQVHFWACGVGAKTKHPPRQVPNRKICTFKFAHPSDTLCEPCNTKEQERNKIKDFLFKRTSATNDCNMTRRHEIKLCVTMCSLTWIPHSSNDRQRYKPHKHVDHMHNTLGKVGAKCGNDRAWQYSAHFPTDIYERLLHTYTNRQSFHLPYPMKDED